MGKPPYRTTSWSEQADSTKSDPATEFLRVAETLRHKADELPAGTVLGNFDLAEWLRGTAVGIERFARKPPDAGLERIAHEPRTLLEHLSIHGYLSDARGPAAKSLTTSRPQEFG